MSAGSSRTLRIFPVQTNRGSHTKSSTLTVPWSGRPNCQSGKQAQLPERQFEGSFPRMERIEADREHDRVEFEGIKV
jgi:hypothetical protein